MAGMLRNSLHASKGQIICMVQGAGRLLPGWLVGGGGLAICRGVINRRKGSAARGETTDEELWTGCSI